MDHPRVCDTECAGECDCSVCRIWQSLQGLFHANWEGKGDFSLERYFCRNRSSLEFCGFLFHLTFQDIFKSPFHVSPEDSYFFVQLGLTLCRPDPEHFLSSFVGVVIAGGPKAMKQSGMCPDSSCFAQSFQKCHSGFHPKCWEKSEVCSRGKLNLCFHWADLWGCWFVCAALWLVLSLDSLHWPLGREKADSNSTNIWFQAVVNHGIFFPKECAGRLCI